MLRRHRGDEVTREYKREDSLDMPYLILTETRVSVAQLFGQISSDLAMPVSSSKDRKKGLRMFEVRRMTDDFFQISRTLP
jgi:hypothetical protein